MSSSLYRISGYHCKKAGCRGPYAIAWIRASKFNSFVFTVLRFVYSVLLALLTSITQIYIDCRIIIYFANEAQKNLKKFRKISFL